MLPTLDRFTGCVLGQCLGDALGSPVEGKSGALCAYYVQEELMVGKVGRLRGDMPFGQYTDDSQMMRELLQSYLACQGFDPADYAKRIVALFAEERIVGYGKSTLQAVKRLEQGIPWDQAGTPPPGEGNGSAMRAASVGLLSYDDLPRLAQLCHQQGIITHQSPRCTAGAIAIAGGVALALQDRVEVNEFSQTLAELTAPSSQEMASYLRLLPQWVKLPPAQAFLEIERKGRPASYFDEWSGTISPFVIPSVLWSLYSFLRHSNSYWETICTSIWPGGDVDTTAAMAGAISGALQGEPALPAQWVSLVQDRGTWTAPELRGLAAAIYHHKHTHYVKE
jgi:ADP-ribosylglycohydrolase